MVQRVGCGDVQQVVDHGPGAGAAGGDPDAHLPHVLDDRGDGEEVRGKAEPGDDAQFFFHPLPRHRVSVQAAPDEPGLAPLAQQPVTLPRPAAGADDLGFGEMRAPQLEVGHRIERAGRGGRRGLCEQLGRAVGSGAGGVRDLPGDLRHGCRLLQPPLARIEPAGAAEGDRPQQPGRVQHIREPVLAGVAVPDRVGDHRRDARVVGQLHGAGRQPQGPGAGARQAVVHAFQVQPVAEQRVPRGEQLLSDVHAARAQGAHRFGHRAEQHDQARPGVLRERGQRQHRGAACGRGVRGGHKLAQPCPAFLRLGQQGYPQPRLRDVRAAPHRRAASAAGAGGGVGGDGEIDTENGTYAISGTGFHETDRPGDAVAVGQRQSAHAALRRPGHQVPRVGGAVAGRVTGGGVQVSKTIAPHLQSLAHPLPGLHLFRYPPYPGNSASVRMRLERRGGTSPPSTPRDGSERWQETAVRAVKADTVPGPSRVAGPAQRACHASTA